MSTAKCNLRLQNNAAPQSLMRNNPLNGLFEAMKRKFFEKLKREDIVGLPWPSSS